MLSWIEKIRGQYVLHITLPLLLLNQSMTSIKFAVTQLLLRNIIVNLAGYASKRIIPTIKLDQQDTIHSSMHVN